jgi:hypothetical protein
MSNAGSITITDFKVYYKVIAIKTAWYWYKNGHEEQRREDPDTNSSRYAHMIFEKLL